MQKVPKFSALCPAQNNIYANEVQTSCRCEYKLFRKKLDICRLCQASGLCWFRISVTFPAVMQGSFALIHFIWFHVVVNIYLLLTSPGVCSLCVENPLVFTLVSIDKGSLHLTEPMERKVFFLYGNRTNILNVFIPLTRVWENFRDKIGMIIF
jgi:hypothetical protein